MAVFGGMTLTQKGIVLQSKAQAGTQIKYTRMAAGDGTLTGQSIPALNGLISPKMNLPIQSVRLQPPNKAVVGVKFSNQDVTAGFYHREMGLFAEDPDVGEILYAYANAGVTADYIPGRAEGGDIIEKVFNVAVTVGTTTNITAVIDDSLVFVQQKKFDVHKHTGAAGDAPKIGSDGLAAGAANDSAIGDRTISDTTAPTGNVGKLGSLLGWIANRIKAITGKAKWTDAPAINLETVASRLDQDVRTTATPTFTGVIASNAANAAANIRLDFQNNTTSRLRIGGTGDGSAANFEIQGVADKQLMKVAQTGDLTIPGRFISTQATGVAPLSVLSTTQVPNLNVQYLQGMQPRADNTNGTIVSRNSKGESAFSFLYLNNASGTAPFSVSPGSAMVTDLGADTVDGYHASETNVQGTLVARDNASRIYATQFVTAAATGIAPLSVSSTTKVANLNVDAVDGYHFNQGVQTTDAPTFAGVNTTGSNVVTSLRTGQKSFLMHRADDGNLHLARSSTNGGSDWNWNTSVYLSENGMVSAPTFSSRVATGTAPLVVASTTKVDNLNVDMVDGYHFNQGLQTSNSPSFAGLTIVGTAGSTQLDGSGNAIRMSRDGANYIAASSPGGYFLFVVNGDSGNLANATLNLGADYSVKTKKNVLDDGTGKATFAGQIGSTMATGTAPFAVASTTTVPNLSADTVDGYHLDQDVRKAAAPTFAGLNLTGTFKMVGAASTVMDFTENDAGTDEKRWWIAVDGKSMQFRTVTDAGGSGVTALAINRGTGTGITGITSSAPVTAPRFISTQAQGTAPLQVTSTTQVNNLNAQYVGGVQIANILHSGSAGITLDAKTAEKAIKWTYATGKEYGITANKDTLSLWDWGNSRNILQYEHATARLTTKAAEVRLGGALELEGAAGGTSYIDFHNVNNSADFDARIISTGGNATNVQGGGQIAMQAKSIVTDGMTFVGRQLGSDATITLAIGDDDTGINWGGDGHLQLYANAAHVASITGNGLAVATTTSYGGSLVRNTIISTGTPPSTSGTNGDIWVQYV